MENHKKKILIVDDEPGFTASTTDILEGEDYNVISASNGTEGFKKARNEAPDVILLDVMMEDVGAGLDIARKLRDTQETSQIPVILNTSVRNAYQLLPSYAPGEQWPNVKATLDKPVEPKFLLKTLQEAIE
jgi:CheY-like chemotaxis protein